MQILSFSDYYTLNLWHPHAQRFFHFEPGKAYLLSDFIFEEMRKVPVPIPVEKISAAEPVLRGFNAAQHPPPAELMFYMGVGGMGDNIMARGVVRHLVRMGYRVHVFCLPILEFAWQGFPWVSSISNLPCYWSLAERFDHHLIFESISNSYTHDRQMHPTDAMLWKLGIDPLTVPAGDKRVPTEFSRRELRVADLMYPGRRLAFYQLSPSQLARRLPPKLSREILWALSEAFPELYWIGIAGGGVEPAYFDPPVLAPNVECRSFDRLRTLWALLRRAEVCVSPDSMLVHAAGIAGVPCVGLWATYPPETRIAYYPNHTVIHKKSACPHSPCNWNAAGLPSFCPPPAPGDRRGHCAVLEAVTPGEVVEAVRAALASTAG